MDGFEAIRRFADERLDDAEKKEAVDLSRRLSARYRERDKSAVAIGSRQEAAAYLISRMPATYAAARDAFGFVRDSMGEPGAGNIKSMLDAGAGLGAASLAACESFGINELKCVERQTHMRSLGEKFMRYASGESLNIEWADADVASVPFTKSFDLAAVSYLINELEEGVLSKTLKSLWEITESILVIIEPGTPECFRRLLFARDMLLGAGAIMLAPCPNGNKCPLPDDDWCGFHVRLPRGRLHKKAKGGEAPFEDEKYCYAAFSKTRHISKGARIIRRPELMKGHARLRLCGGDGIQTVTVSKSDGDAYAAARRARCGEIFYKINKKV